MSATIETKAAEVTQMMSTATKAGVEQATKLMTDGAAQTRAALEKSMEHANKTARDMFKASEDAAEFSRGNVEALSRATQIYFTGLQDLGRQTMALMQGITDHALEGAKALAAVKSLKEAADIQSNLGRAAFERATAETTRLQEASLKLAEQAFAPITARVSLAVERMTKPVVTH
jgi:phasin family protein